MNMAKSQKHLKITVALAANSLTLAVIWLLINPKEENILCHPLTTIMHFWEVISGLSTHLGVELNVNRIKCMKIMIAPPKV